MSQSPEAPVASSALPQALAAAALAAQAVALTRLLGLSAGTPAAGSLVAAGLLAGLAIGLSGRWLAGRPAALLAAVAGLLAALGLPAILAPWPAAGGIAGLVAAAVIGWGVGRAGLMDLDRPRIAVLALGLLVAGMASALTGPLPLALAASLLLVLASLLGGRAREDGLARQEQRSDDIASASEATGKSAEPSASEPWLSPALLGLGCALALSAALMTQRSQVSAPWPFGFALAAMLLLGWAMGRGAGLRTSWAGIAAMATGLAGLALGLHGDLARAATALAERAALQPLEPRGAALSILLGALVLGLPVALALGAAAARELDRPTLLGASAGLLAVAFASAAFASPLALLSLGAAALVAADLVVRVGGGGRRPARAIASVLLSLVAVTATWWADDAVRGLRMLSSGTCASVTTAEGGMRLLSLDGQPVASSDPDRGPSGRLAGHLAGLLPGKAGRALVIGWPLPGLLEALATHHFESVTVAEPVPGAWSLLSASSAPASDVAVRWVSAQAPGSLPDDAPQDAIVLALGDPRLRQGQAFVTPSGRAELARRLSPDGTFVEIIDLDRLAPPQVFAGLALLAQALPDPVLLMADQGRSGILLAAASPAAAAAAPALTADEPATAPRADLPGPVSPEGAGTPAPAEPAVAGPAEASSPDASESRDAPSVRRDVVLLPATAAPRDRPFPLDRLLDGERITAEVEASLRAALLLNPAQLMATLVAGPSDIAMLGERAAPADPWTPGPSAFLFAPGAEAARPLAEALFFGRLQVTDIVVRPAAWNARGDRPRAVPFIGIETRLGNDWTVTGRLRYQKRLAGFLGTPGVYRERARRLDFVKEGEALLITERPLHGANLDVLQDSIEGLATSRALRRGTALLNGHPALWQFEQNSPDEQVIVATWHCPVSDRLYGLRYRLTRDVKPGMYEEPLQTALGNVRCSHGPAARGDVAWRPAAEPVSATATPDGAEAHPSETVPPVPGAAAPAGG